MTRSFLFAHGWATDHRVWTPYIESLKEADKESLFINPDLPGHGELSTDRWAEPTLVPAIDKYLKILENIPSNGGDATPIGVGWSLGALVLLSIEILRPGTFKALVIVGATPSFVSTKGFPYGQKKGVVKLMMRDFKRAPIETLMRFYSLNFTDLELAGSNAGVFMDRYNALAKTRLDTDSLLNSLAVLYNNDIIEELGSIRIPVLIVHGAKDNVAPIDAGRFLERGIERATLEIFESSGHAPFLTGQEAFLRKTKDFFQDIEFIK